MPKLRVYVDGPLPKNADELDDLNRAFLAMAAVHGVDLGKVTLAYSASSKSFSAFYATDRVLPVDG